MLMVESEVIVETIDEGEAGVETLASYLIVPDRAEQRTRDHAIRE